MSPPSRATSNALVPLFVAALAIWFLIRVVDIVRLVFLAILLGVYLSAVTDFLERRFNTPRWAGLTITVVVTLAALVGMGALLIPPVVDQTQSLISGLPQTLSDIQTVLARWTRQSAVLRQSELANPESGLVAGLVDSASTFVQESFLPSVKAGGALFIHIFSVLVMALYLARQPALYRDGIVALFPPQHRDLTERVLSDAGATLKAWVVGQLLAMTVLGVLTAIGLLALGVPYWLAFGIFTGLVAVVPFFGTLVSTILPALFVVGEGSWVKVVAVLLLGVVVHLFEANVVVPRIMERKVALPPVLTIVSVLIMGVLLGGVGLVVAVPILAVLVVVVRHVLRGAVYGEDIDLESAVLQPTGQHRIPKPAVGGVA